MQNRCSNSRIFLLFWILFLPGLLIFSQDHKTKNNYTGAWATPSSWDPSWAVPQTNVNNLDITINGYITANSSLIFLGASSKLIVDDTLVINGNLTIANDNDVQVNNNGILIIHGNLIFSEDSKIEARNYIIITGNITKLGSTNHGEFFSDDNPVKVFIGGIISPSSLYITKPNFPVFNCSSPPTTPYSYSGCSYGSMTDIITNPIYPFFQSTCPIPTLTSSDANNSFCLGTSVTFTSGGGTNYNFRVNAISVQNGVSATYTSTSLTNGSIVDVVVTGICTSTSPGITNTVFSLPVPTITGPAALCIGATGNVYTTQAGMSNYLWTVSAGGTITAGGSTGNNSVTITWTTTGAKTVKVNYTNGNGCTAISQTTYNITVNPLPVPTIAGPAALCEGATGNVYATEAGMSNYLWTVSAGGSITAGGGTGNNTVTVTWTTTGAKTVKVNYTNGNGCTATSQTTYNITVNPLPVPTIGGPAALCVGATGNVYTTEAGMSNYLWTVSAGGTITAGGGTGNNSVTVTWTTTGAKTVKVNYTNGNGCTATSQTTYNITVNPLPVPTIAGPAALCVGATGNVYTTEAGMSNYLWTVSVGGTITAGGGAANNTVTVTWTTTGATTVTVNYTNGNGCTAASQTTYNITVNPIPVPTIAGPAALCEGATGNVYTTEAGMSNYLWTVSAGGSITAGGGTGNNTVTVTWTTTGAKTVTVNYTNGKGCTATGPETINVTVNLLQTATAGNNGPVCVGSALSLAGGPAGMTSYSWTGPNGFNSSLQNPSVSTNVTLAMSGIYSLTITNASGCSSTASTTVTINDLPVVTASNNGPVCVGNSLSLTGGPASATYMWTGPNGFTSSMQNPFVSDKSAFAMSGDYILTATSANGCLSTATTTVTVNENPIVFAGPDQELTFVFETQMAAELTPPETGEWTLVSGGGRISSIKSPTTLLTELSTGENIFLWKVQKGGCKASDEVKIIVKDLFVPSVITPDGDGKNDYFKISENIGRVELIIFNRWGKEEYRNSNYLNDWEGRNNSGTELPFDTYFYILKLEGGKMRKGSVLIIR